MSSLSKIASLCLLAAIIISTSGCILSPKADAEPPDTPEEKFLDLTKKEHVIPNLVLAYKRHNISKYDDLLHVDYLWFMQKEEVPSGEEQFWLRYKDYTATENVFLAADNRHPDPTKNIDKLNLTIGEGSWYKLESIEGNPCDDCWQTERQYMIEVVMGETTLLGNDHVIFYIVPYMKDGVKVYQILRAYDIIYTPA